LGKAFGILILSLPNQYLSSTCKGDSTPWSGILAHRVGRKNTLCDPAQGVFYRVCFAHEWKQGRRSDVASSNAQFAVNDWYSFINRATQADSLP